MNITRTFPTRSKARLAAQSSKAKGFTCKLVDNGAQAANGTRWAVVITLGTLSLNNKPQRAIKCTIGHNNVQKSANHLCSSAVRSGKVQQHNINVYTIPSKKKFDKTLLSNVSCV